MLIHTGIYSEYYHIKIRTQKVARMCGLIILATITVTLCDNAQSFSSTLVDVGILQNTDLYTIIPSAVATNDNSKTFVDQFIKAGV